MAMIISLNIDAGSSRLQSRSLICFISLKERSTVAVDSGSTMAMVSRSYDGEGKAAANVEIFSCCLQIYNTNCKVTHFSPLLKCCKFLQ